MGKRAGGTLQHHVLGNTLVSFDDGAKGLHLLLQSYRCFVTCFLIFQPGAFSKFFTTQREALPLSASPISELESFFFFLLFFLLH